MNPLTTLVRSLGNDRALANAGAVLYERQREDWLVQGLARRIDRTADAAATRPAASTASAAA